MKLNLTSNGKAYGYGTFRSVLDFFFPIGNRIRCEGTANIRRDKFGNVSTEYSFFTFRNLFIHYFNTLFIIPQKNGQKELTKYLGINPRFAYRLGAIALDTGSSGHQNSGVGTTFTISYTVTGSNPIMFSGGAVAGEDGATDSWVSTTYNSVGLTQVNKIKQGLSYWNYLDGLLNPATGTHDWVVTSISNHSFTQSISSFSGVDQTTAISSLVNNTQGSTGSITATLTTPVDNSWTLLMVKGDNTLSAGSGSTLIAGTSQSDPCAMYDSNGPITPSGSYSMTANASGGAGISGIMVSFAPFGATPGGGAVTRRRMLMGIGQ